MTSSSQRFSTTIAAILFCLAWLGSDRAHSAVVTVNENRIDLGGPPGNNVTFDTKNAVTTGTTNLLPNLGFATGSGNTNFRNRHNSPGGANLTPTMIVNNDSSYALGTGFNRGGTSVQYYSLRGNTGNRDSITVGWGTTGSNLNGSPNGAGADLLVMEWSNNEGYLVRVSTNGGTNYSDWRYTPAAWSAHNSSDGHLTWQTFVDYSDFGVAPGQSVTNVQFSSILAGDKGLLSGSSYLLDNVNGTPLINPQTGLAFANSGISGYSNGTDLTADIWYAVSLNDIAAVAEVPEPASLVAWTLIAMVAVSVSWRRRGAVDG